MEQAQREAERRQTALKRERRRQDAHWGFCFWLFFFTFVIIIILWAALVYNTHQPYENYPPTRTDGGGVGPLNANLRTGARGKGHCFASEKYDAHLGLCVPDFKVPLSVDDRLMDRTQDACEDFFSLMCGAWNKRHHNEDRTFGFAMRRNKAIVTQLFHDNPESPAGKFFSSCMATFASHGHNTEMENALELKHLVERISKPVKSHRDLPIAFASLALHGFTAPFAFSIQRHPTEAMMVPMFSFDSLGVNATTVRTMLVANRIVLGFRARDLMQKVQLVMEVERALNSHDAHGQTPVDFDMYVKRFLDRDMRTMHWLQLAAGDNADFWPAYLNKLHANLTFDADQTVWIMDQSYMAWLFSSRGMHAISPAAWRAWIEFSILHHAHDYVPLLPHDAYYKTHDFYGPLFHHPQGRVSARIHYQRIPPHLGSGVRQVRTADGGYHPHLQLSEADCVRVTQQMLPGHVAQSFLHRVFPGIQHAKVRQDVRSVVQAVVRQLKEEIQKHTSYTKQTKDMAIEKLDALRIRVAEPTHWHVEPFGDVINKDAYLYNINMIRRYRTRQNIDLWFKTKERFDRDAIAFFAAPLTQVNAYYSPTTNTITIFAGILLEPFYSLKQDTLSKFALMGTVIAHELHHGLDVHGIQWDAQGSYVPTRMGWLAEADQKTYNKALQCVTREYDDGIDLCKSKRTTYGEKTLSENMADLGMQTAYEAWLKAERTPTSGGQRQHFWMAAAQMWCASYDDAFMCKHLHSEDVHSVPMLRVNKALKHTPGFQDAFGCAFGQKMYTEKMCKVW